MKKAIIYLFGAMLATACSASPQETETAEPIPTITEIATEQATYLPVIQEDVSTISTPTEIMATPTETIAPTLLPTVEPIYGRTDHQLDGNRIVAGSIYLPDILPRDISLDGKPIWVTSAPYNKEGVLWVAVLDTGNVEAYLVTEDDITAEQISPEILLVGMPPLLVVMGDEAKLAVPTEPYSEETHPLLWDEGMAYISPEGSLVIEQNEKVSELEVNALLDGRLLLDEQQRILLLTDPDPSYPHDVLGDALEAKSVTLIDTAEPSVLQTITMEGDWVIEGISPIWADLTGDGNREIIITRSNRSQGAQIMIYQEDGSIVATGPAIGQGARWRHQLAVADFSGDGRPNLVDVLTPHLGGVVEFYQVEQDQLIIDATTRGYTSHVIGTRNLDMAIAGDWSNTGEMQLLLPTQNRQSLGSISYTDGAVWEVPVGGVVSTNLSATNKDGQLQIGVGREDNTLRIWQATTD